MGVLRTKLKNLPPEQAAVVDDVTDPEQEVEVTVEAVPDFSKIPPDVLEEQKKKILAGRADAEAGAFVDDTEVLRVAKKYTRK